MKSPYAFSPKKYGLQGIAILTTKLTASSTTLFLFKSCLIAQVMPYVLPCMLSRVSPSTQSAIWLSEAFDLKAFVHVSAAFATGAALISAGMSISARL